ncbi:MAG: hypothetical protein KGJ35_01430 [Patescibacteria group bacterium]|nr:hypothetical protein [Patescibacteria group bacterium]
MKKNQGLIRLIILILIALVILGYYGISVRQAIQNPTSQDNISYIWNGAVYIWATYLKAPATFLWNIFVNDIWNPAIYNLEHIKNGQMPPLDSSTSPDIPSPQY